jgi:uncharacterized membrane protein YedE/YeeE
MRANGWLVVVLLAAVALALLGFWQVQRGNAGGWVLVGGAAVQLAVAWFGGHKGSRKDPHG